MKLKAIVSIAVFSLLAAVASAQAQSTVVECEARIALVQEDLNAVSAAGGIGGNNPTQTYASLSSKLQAATTKLEQEKNADALRKLLDFKTAVVAMQDSAKPKISAADAGLLLDGNDDLPIDEGVNGAISCVALLP